MTSARIGVLPAPVTARSCPKNGMVILPYFGGPSAAASSIHLSAAVLNDWAACSWKGKSLKLVPANGLSLPFAGAFEFVNGLGVRLLLDDAECSHDFVRDLAEAERVGLTNDAR